MWQVMKNGHAVARRPEQGFGHSVNAMPGTGLVETPRTVTKQQEYLLGGEHAAQ